MTKEPDITAIIEKIGIEKIWMKELNDIEGLKDHELTFDYDEETFVIEIDAYSCGELFTLNISIFDPYFLKSYFGEHWGYANTYSKEIEKARKTFKKKWQYYGYKLVISEDRIKYLKQFL